MTGTGTSEFRHVVSVSIGSSKRDHRVEWEAAGFRFLIERRGTDGDLDRAEAMIRELDGSVDAFGMGGIDLYVVAGRRRYRIRDAVRLAAAARVTPIVDGSGLKNTLERNVVAKLRDEGVLRLRGKTVLLVSSVDRFGMAEELARSGCRLILGDLIFLLGVPIPLTSLRTLDYVARVVGPIACRLPIHMLYPTGKRPPSDGSRYGRFYREADLIAGDFHLIRRHLPDRLDGKTILTNTVTAEDVSLLKERGAGMLITTTPELGGRSFGTNVMEAVLVAATGKKPADLTEADYHHWLERLEFRPRVETLQ